MIKKEQILSLEYYNYGGVFTGSLQGMRYRVEKVKEEEVEYFVVHAWKEPYGYDVTPKEDRKQKKFIFSDEGAQKAVEWLNLLYEEVYEEKEEEDE